MSCLLQLLLAEQLPGLFVDLKRARSALGEDPASSWPTRELLVILRMNS